MKSKIDEESVRKTLLPELEYVKDTELRDKAVKAWRLACEIGGYDRLEDVPTEAFELMPDVSNIQHQKGTARIAFALAKVNRELGVELNEDYCVVGALCHDVGKPIEWRNNQQGTFAVTQGLGVFYGRNANMPSLGENGSYQIARHSVLGLYVAMTVGMPEHVIHIISSHSKEGDFLLRSPEAWIVKYSDEIWWAEVAPQHIGKYAAGVIPDRLEGAIMHVRRLDWRKGPPENSQT